MNAPQRSRATALLAPLLCLAACTPTTRVTGAFPRHATAVRAGDVLAKVARPEPRPAQTPGVVGITQDGALFAWSFEGGLLWQRPIDAASAPLLVGELVITAEGDQVVARALDSGKRRFAIDAGDARLVGADSAGGLTVVSLLVEEDGRARGLLVAARGSKIVWETEFSHPAGSPALSAGHVIVPWGTLHVSMLRAADGTEAQRVDLKDSVAGHAFVDRGRAFVGQHGLLQVDRGLESGKREMSTYYSPEARPMPGQPGLLRDAYEPVPPPAHAGHRVRLDWRVAAEGDALQLQDAHLYLHFYRFIFALDAEQDAIAWLYEGAEDVAGTAVVKGGIYLVDSGGQLRFLNALGHPTWSKALGVSPLVAVVRAADVAPTATPADAPVAASTETPAAAPAGDAPASAVVTPAVAATPATPATPATGAAAEAAAPSEATPAEPAEVYRPRPLQQQLADAAALDDPRLASGRAFAVEHLARFDDAAVTEVLLSLCDDPGAPDLVRAPACRHLAERKQGQDAVLAALSRRASYRAHIPPPPVGALAGAAAAMSLRRAAPLLLRHAEDPHTPTRDLGPTFVALSALRHRPAVASIETFVRLHHAEPREANLQQALTGGLDALVALEGKRAADTLDLVAQDPFSMPGVGEYARRAAERLRAPPAAQSPEAAPVAAKDKDPEPPLLRYLSMDVVARALRPVERKLRRCLVADSTGAVGARLSMVVHGDGHIERVFVTPASAQACLEGVLSKVRFPASAQGRQQVVHVVKPRPAGRAARAGKPKKKKKKAGAAERTRIAEH